MDIEVVNRLVKALVIFPCIYIVFLKVIDYKNINKMDMIKITVCNIVICISYVILSTNYKIVIANIICIPIYSLMISNITRNDFLYTIGIVTITTGLVYGLLIITSLMSSLIIFKFKFLFSTLMFDFMLVFTALILELLIICLLLKIKRFKNGFSFAKNKNYINNLGIFIIILCAIIVIIYLVAGYGDKDRTQKIYIITVMLLTITYWLIKRLTTVYYKQTLKDDEIKYLTNAHKEDQAKLEIAYNEIDALTEINHKYSTSINAAKDAIRKLENSMNTEFSEELTNLKQMTENLSTNFDNELKTKIHINQDIQRTNVAAIDAVITYLNNLAKEDGIKLKFKTECEIKEFISNTIDASKIAMILGDHIKDAIIAINFSNNTNKNIETILRKNNETYEICISDSGIEFEIGTLLKLGTQRVTTHKKTGGTGIGFMTTFDTVKACKGSIEIQEYETDENNFKKSVVISFDGKCEYRIHSYRAEKIKVKDRDNRIVIY